MLVQNEADKLLMIPGPTPVQREILAAMGEPTISHTSAPLADIVRRSLAGLRPTVGTTQAEIFVFAGSGTLAQEAAVVNLVAPGERLLVVSNGVFGDRFVGIGTAHGIEVERLAARWGESVTAAELDARLAGGRFRAVTITQVETSTGTRAPLPDLVAVARRHGALTIVDAVCALGGLPVDMDQYDIDIVLSGAQKALGVPPGLAILAASPAALDRRRELPRVSTYYADLLNWQASMADPQVYFSTHAVNLFYALLASTEIIAREGISARFARHERLARSFRAGARAVGFGPLTDDHYLAPTLSVLAYPPGVDDAAFRAALSERGVVAAACLGEFKGRGARFGHMGNIAEAEVLQVLGAMEDVLRALGAGGEPGVALSAARQALAEEAVLS